MATKTIVIIPFITALALVGCSPQSKQSSNSTPSPSGIPQRSGERAGNPEGFRQRLENIDYDAAASKLGVDAQQLRQLLTNTQTPLNLEEVAVALNVNIEDLRQVLGIPQFNRPDGLATPSGSMRPPQN